MFARELINKNEAISGLNVFFKAIGKLQRVGKDDSGQIIIMENCLTSVHSDILRLALASKYFSGPILNLIYTDYTKVILMLLLVGQIKSIIVAVDNMINIIPK